MTYDESYIDENEELLSVCCGSLQCNEIDGMCGKCKEWTEFQVTCMGCGGIGYILINEHQNEPCPNPNCEDGYILIEE